MKNLFSAAFDQKHRSRTASFILVLTNISSENILFPLAKDTDLSVSNCNLPDHKMI